MSVLYSLIDTLLPFEWTEFAYMKNAFLAVLLITPLFGLVGTMVVNNKMSFFSDALGHSALTGIAIGVLLGVDNYLLSMLGFALLFALCISAVMSSGTSSADTIIGVFSSTGLALGVVLLSATGGFAKYSSYLIGDILTVQPSEIGLLAIVLAAVVIVWILFFNRFLLTSVNTDLAASKNIHTLCRDCCGDRHDYDQMGGDFNHQFPVGAASGVGKESGEEHALLSLLGDWYFPVLRRQRLDCVVLPGDRSGRNHCFDRRSHLLCDLCTGACRRKEPCGLIPVEIMMPHAVIL